jgi:hypothetical protein
MAEVLPLGQMEQFMAEILERDEHAQKAARLVQAILKAGSLWISDLDQAMRGTSPDANYKAIQRFLKEADPKQVLLRLLDEEAPFSIGDGTEVERPDARRTGDGGRLSDGKILGFWLLVRGPPDAGRAIPFAFACDSDPPGSPLPQSGASAAVPTGERSSGWPAAGFRPGVQRSGAFRSFGGLGDPVWDPAEWGPSADDPGRRGATGGVIHPAGSEGAPA